MTSVRMGVRRAHSSAGAQALPQPLVYCQMRSGPWWVPGQYDDPVIDKAYAESKAEIEGTNMAGANLAGVNLGGTNLASALTRRQAVRP